MPKQPRTPEARAALATSIAYDMLAQALDSPDKHLSLRYPCGGLKYSYNRLVALTGDHDKHHALERAGLLLIIENDNPQAVKVMAAAKEESMQRMPV